MKVLNRFKGPNYPVLEDSGGAQEVLAIITNDFDYYLVFRDKIENSTYIERIIDKTSTSLKSSNLSKIETEEEFLSVLTLCVDENIIKIV
jgi:hypothetical protein